VYTDWNSQICAGLYEGGKDTCQGDSGGGLYALDTIDGKKRYVLVGIVSYGMGCGLRGYPGIYTRTSYYLDWINKNR
jgi:secreted trypsin-like serine protease